MGVMFGEISNEIFEIIEKEDYESLLYSKNEYMKELVEDEDD